MPEDKTFFDVSRPDKVGADPNSKPVIVGHHPTMMDPMVSSRDPSRTMLSKHHPIHVKDPTSKESAAIKSFGADSFSEPRAREHQRTEPTESDSLVKGEPLQSPPFELESRTNPSKGSGRLPMSPISSLTGMDIGLSSDRGLKHGRHKPKEQSGNDDDGPLELPAGNDLHHHRPHPLWWLLPPLIVLVALYAALDSKLIPNDLNLPFNIFKKSESVDSTSTYTSPTTTPTTPAANQIPDNWATYENKELGFKFAYPKDWGALAPAEANNNLLIHIATPAKQTLAQNLSGRLDFGIWKKETANIPTSKYGPVVKPVVSANETSWVVAAKGSSDLYPQKVGDKYDTQAQVVSGLKIFNFSYSDDGCSFGRWVVELKTGNYADVTLPGLCPVGTVSAVIPSANQQAYIKTFSDIANTFSTPS